MHLDAEIVDLTQQEHGVSAGSSGTSSGNWACIMTIESLTVKLPTGGDASGILYLLSSLLALCAHITRSTRTWARSLSQPSDCFGFTVAFLGHFSFIS